MTTTGTAMCKSGRKQLGSRDVQASMSSETSGLATTAKG